MRIMEPVITSRKNPLVMATTALHEKKYRYEEGLFIVEGEKLVCEAADQGLPIVRLFISAARSAELLDRLSPHFASSCFADLPVYTLADECFLKISTEKSPQGVIAVIKHLDFFQRRNIIYNEDVLSLGNGRTVLLYDMQDPGNLGAVIRSAVALGADHILLSGDCADLYNSKTIRAAMGSLFRVHALVVQDFLSAVHALQASGRRVLAAELREGALPVQDASLSSRDCVLIGNEGHGIPEDISRQCDASVYLPISARAESLNAAVAAAIFLWEQSKA